MNSNAFQREPIFWTSTIPGYNDSDRMRTFMRDGKRVTVRYPQRGHVGDYENKQKAPGDRFLWMIDHHGFEFAMVLTCAAAHLNAHDGYGQDRMRKARHFGWYMPGQCPCALMATGELSPDHIVDRSLIGQQPCEPGTYSFERRCKHSLSERAARAAQNKAIQDERELAMKPDAAKSVEATQALTEKLVETVTAALATPKRGKSDDR